jgi:chromosome segregation ATPase
MWPVLLVVAAAFAADRVLRYKHSRRSRWAVAGTYVVSLGVSFAFVESQWPGLDLGTRLVLTVAGSLPVFLLLALAVLEVWRYSKLRSFNDRIHALREELANAEELAHAVERRQETVTTRREDLTGRNRGRVGELNELRARVAAWEEGGGLTRVRSVKLDEWRQQYATIGSSALAARRAELEADFERVTAGGDDEAAAGIRAQLDTLRLAQLEGHDVAGEIDALGKALNESEQELATHRAAVERLKGEIGDWEMRRDEYVKRGVALD